MITMTEGREALKFGFSECCVTVIVAMISFCRERGRLMGKLWKS